MHLPETRRSHLWTRGLKACAARAVEPQRLVVAGKLTRMVGLTLEAVGCQAAIGGRCLIETGRGEPIEAEVVGFHGERIYLMPIGELHGLVPDARVIPLPGVSEVAVGDALLGRVIDGAGKPLDGKGPIGAEASAPLTGRPINPLTRAPIREPLDVGVAAINALLSVGRGQRMGLFAGSGVGKSVLLGMMTRYTNADVIVVGLVGERGREVKEFVQNILGEEGLARAVVVATPADTTPLMRLHGAMQATSIAEYFRDQGKQVLLLMDSLTRFAQAQRELALAIGEPPATKGYPPSVFARLPQLVERAGTGDRGGSITAFYTVLAEGDDQNDPIADAARAILDGHVVLSRELADAGHYPAIDIESSISRVMVDIVAPEHDQAARRFKQIWSTWQQNRDLVNIGAYQRGSDPQIDEAIALYPQLASFLQQHMKERVDWNQSLVGLATALGVPPGSGAGGTEGKVNPGGAAADSPVHGVE
ncbi:MAG TPA: flagellar protein export ATPase FliI [Gammaproteobacteria bacterium]|nr:flagellar protein export ATPase FliI [Gammaproteobacteria bacterium]